MNKRVVSLLAATVVGASVLTGCGAGSGASGSTVSDGTSA